MSLCLIASDPQDELELKQVFFVCQELKKKGLKFFILTNPGSRLASQAKLQAVRVINYKLEGNPGWFSTRKLERLMKKNQVQLVHFFDRSALSSGFKAAQKAGVKVRVASWKSDWNPKELVGLLGQLEAVICEAEETKRLLLRNNLPASQLEIIPVGLDLSQFKGDKKDFLRKELNLSSDNFLVGLLSPLEDTRAFKNHLEALRILEQEAPKLKIIVLGMGALNLEMLKQEQALRMENLYFYLGFNESLAEVMSSLDLFVFGAFSLPEEFLLKAMVLKLPVVGVLPARMTELIIHRETGLLVPPNDPPALAQAILKLYLDRSLAQTLSRQAYELVSNKHSCEAMAQKMVNHYEFLALQKGVKIG
ncbi:MAG: glycosyltransferase family 4 protein [Acidobacteriota bacterium]|nr:glycosyltransferase family 4 protein [Acidobacteriota bacterium]MDW3229360.1 glycosyltransferase family 4 protein [Acidobacteriota bacterium]